MSTAAPPKPPYDPLPWIYWGIFFIVLPLIALWMMLRPSPIFSILAPTVPVLVRDVPAYHVITANDVTTKTLEAKEVMTNTVRDAQKLIGHYTLNALSMGKPVSENQIASVRDQNLISNTLAVAIPATSATILGGKLRAGDVVSLTIVPISDTTAAPTMVFDQVLVLDVSGSEKDIVVVLAIPSSRWLEYLSKTRNATLVIARRVE